MYCLIQLEGAMKLVKSLCASALIGLSGNVLADIVTYAGSSCTPGYGATYSINPLGSMTNFGFSSSISLSCNIPTVDGQNTINSITIHYIDNNPNGTLQCHLRGGSSMQVFNSTGASQGQRTFTFNSSTINNRVPQMLNCTLPPNTSGPAPALVKYTVDIQ